MSPITTKSKLGSLMSLPALDGTFSLAAVSGLLVKSNALMLAVPLIAGPAVILAAILLPGGMKERLVAAFLAGVIATALVCVAAILGPRLLVFCDLELFRRIGGVAVILIGLLVMGVNIPQRLPLFVMMGGFVASILLK